jgi:hypothetical protein
MQISVFNPPTSSVVLEYDTIGDINQLDLYSFEKQLLLEPLDSTEPSTTIDVSMGDMMELKQNHSLHLPWEDDGEQNRKHGEPPVDKYVCSQINNPFKYMVSTDSEKEKYFPEFPCFDFIDNTITDRDRMEFKLSPNFNITTNHYTKKFSNVEHIYLLVEDNKTYTGFVTIDNIIKNLVKHMVMVNEGLCHSWMYRGRECYAILDWAGCWNLYAIAPMEYVDDARPLTCNDPPTHFLAWDENNNMYKVLLDMTTDTILPNLETDEVRLGSTFKDLSYCKDYVNMFVDGIRRGDGAH